MGNTVKEVTIRPKQITPTVVPIGTETIMVDASWEGSNKAGWGLTGYDEKGELFVVRFGVIRATDPLHAEAQAMMQTLTLVQHRYAQRRGVRAMILTDCQVLISAMLRNCVEDLPIWRAAQVVAECGQMFKQQEAHTTLEKAMRKTVQDPHNLANWARRTGTSFQGSRGEVSELNFTI